MTHRPRITGLVLAMLALLLAACSGSPTLAEVAPLDKDRPTLLYFYTDS